MHLGRLKTRNWEVPALIVSLLILAGAVVALGRTWFEPPPIHNTADVLITNEIGDERLGEVLKRHFRRSNGTMLKTLVYYRDKSVGTVMYRPDNTYETFKIVAEDGFVLRESTYDNAGKLVVNGFEMRLDRTLLWRTETLADGSLKTVTYWRDGKQPFSVRVRNLKASTIEYTYYRQNGNVWLTQVGLTNMPPSEEKVFDAAGRLSRLINRQSDGGAKVTVFREDGTAYFQQTWIVSASEHHYSVDLRHTIVFAADGVSRAMSVDWGWGRYASSITVYQPDGTRVVNFYYTKAEPKGRRHVAADNTTISESDVGADPELIAKLDPAFYTRDVPAPENPLPAWQEAEK